jgi:hypothetical protein
MGQGNLWLLDMNARRKTNQLDNPLFFGCARTSGWFSQKANVFARLRADPF